MMVLSLPLPTTLYEVCNSLLDLTFERSETVVELRDAPIDAAI